jgi:uncharacterized membrane protein YphA (DoxX/SURF4 family)
MPIQARSAAYWTTTTLTALFPCVLGGAVNLFRPEAAVQGMAALGYPAYVLTIIGAWKVLGGIAMIAPRLPRLKEWAYAGLAFDLTGAAFSHAAVGDAAGKVVTPLLLLAIAMVSWALRPADRRLGAAPLELPPAGSRATFARSEPSGA